MSTTRTLVKVAAGTLGVAAASGLLLWYVFREEESDDVETVEKRHYSSRRAATRNRLPRPRVAPKPPGKEPRISARVAAARRNCIPAFSKILAIAEQCRSRGKTWNDDRFPAAERSLYKDPSNPPKDWIRKGEKGHPVENVEVSWQSPEQFCKRVQRLGVRQSWLYGPDPKVKVEDSQKTSETSEEADSTVQGSFGNSNFLCALAGAVRDIQIGDDIIDAEFEDCGIYGVSFWLHDKWQMVWVDSFFPGFRSGQDPWRLIFPHGEQTDEIWSLLVEKAFAKLQGSYEALSISSVSAALSLLTSCPAQSLDLHSPSVSAEQIFEELILARHRGMFISARARLDISSKLANGIAPGHAYTVVDALATSSKRFLKLRNPCGDGEWKGFEQTYSELDERPCSANEFWIELADAIERFETIDWCAVDDNSEEHDQVVNQIKALGKLQAPSKSQQPQSESNVSVDERSLEDLVKAIEGIEGASKKRTPRHSKRGRGGRL